MGDSELLKIARGLSRNIFERLDDISATEFPTRAPLILADIIRKLTESVLREIELTNVQRIAKYACQSLQELASHLRYMEHANAARVSTSVVTPIEAIINRIQPGARVMLRVQHTYNYSVFDILAVYKTMFGELLPDLEEILGDAPHFFVIGVPLIEYSNILLHAALGHELGHRLADKYIKAENQATLVSHIEHLIGKDLSWIDPDYDKLPPLFNLELRQRVFNAVLEARERALKELISDAAGYYLLGVSAAFAVEHIAMSDVLDALPKAESRYYPPWRYRLRQLVSLIDADNLPSIINSLDGEAPLPAIRKSCIARLQSLADVVRDDQDIQAIDDVGILTRAYKDIPSVLTNISAFLEKELPRLRFLPDTVKVQLNPLLERLSLGIPPDEIPGGVPDFRTVLLAGWLYRISRLPIPYTNDRSWTPADDEIVNRLVLKAIESIHLIGEFNRSRVTS